MRFTTMTSVAVLALSAASLAQVASTPAEQKPEGNVGGNEMSATDNSTSSRANTAPMATTSTPQTSDPTIASPTPKKP